MVCAVCGPDGENAQPGQVTSKFINLAKLTDRDFHYEALRICAFWFEKVLEGSATSHNTGSSQAHTGKLTTRGGKSATDLRRKLLETIEELERRVQDSEGAASHVPYQNSALSSSTQVVGLAGTLGSD